jgi:magnesium transporter
MKGKKYLDYFFNPLDLLRTKELLQVNPTIIPERKENIESKIFLIEYSQDEFEFKPIPVIEDCFKHLYTEKVSWINIDGINRHEIESISKRFGVHQLIVDDILSVGQRPKMDEINDTLFCVLNMLYFNERSSTVETEQISMVLGKNFILSFQEDANRDVFDGVREKVKLNTSKVRQGGADFLYYILVDSIVDHYFLVMEKLAEKIELLEEDITKNADNLSLIKINAIRKELILLKRSIGPVRELIHGVIRSENNLIQEKTEKYFKDVYDHVVQANDLAENYRDMMINLQDLYMSNVNLKQNEVMKWMAIVTCLLAPATVIGAIFGMNFEKIPLLHNKWGFLVCAIVMVFTPVWMWFYFKRKKWF